MSRTVSLAVCASCGITGPARCVAVRSGWTRRGPEQRRRWYCPSHPLATATVVGPAASASGRTPVLPAPEEPFAALRRERDAQARLEAGEARPQFSILRALRDFGRT